MADSATIKVIFGEDLRRLTVATSITFAELVATVGQLFGLAPHDVAFNYRDSDGDLISVASDLELHQIIKEGTVRLTVTVRTEMPGTPRPDHQQAPQRENYDHQQPDPEPPRHAPEPQAPKPVNFEDIIENFGGFLEEAQRVWLSNPQLQEQARTLASQFGERVKQFAEQQQTHHANFTGAFGHFGPFGLFGHPCAQMPTASSHCAQASPASASPAGTPSQSDLGYDESVKLADLAGMGFYDTELNKALLRRHLGNTHRVVAELVQ